MIDVEAKLRRKGQMGNPKSWSVQIWRLPSQGRTERERPAEREAATAWWEELTPHGSEGIVVKPGVKRRWHDNLRLIYFLGKADP